MEHLPIGLDLYKGLNKFFTGCRDAWTSTPTIRRRSTKARLATGAWADRITRSHSEATGGEDAGAMGKGKSHSGQNRVDSIFLP